MKETKIEQALVTKVKEHGGKCYKLTGYKGIPDRIALLPGGKVIFVETKQPQGRLSPVQIVVQNSLRSLGFNVYTIWDMMHIAEVLDRERKYCGS